MTCPEPGLLRAWLDRDPASDTPDLSGHLAACPLCRAALDELRQVAGLAAVAVGALAPDALPTAAEAPIPATGASPMRTLARPFQHWRAALAGLAAALALVFLVGTPAGRAAAQQFLAQFRSQRFTVVTIDSQEAQRPFLDLEKLGTISGLPRDHPSTTVQSLAEASQRVGFAVKAPDAAALPAELAGAEPTIQVLPATQVRFTLDRAKTLAYLKSTGHGEVQVPQRLDGATLVVNVPAMALLHYGQTAKDYGQAVKEGTRQIGPTLVVGQSGLITAGTEGNVSLDELRDFLLSLPGFSPRTARQLKAINDWKNTLPIPIPADLINWRETTIAGSPGLLLADNSGLGSAAIWQRDGRVYGVAGTLKGDEIQRVASSLH